MAKQIKLVVIIDVPDDSEATAQEFVGAFDQLVEYDTMGEEATLPDWEGIEFREDKNG